VLRSLKDPAARGKPCLAQNATLRNLMWKEQAAFEKNTDREGSITQCYNRSGPTILGGAVVP